MTSPLLVAVIVGMLCMRPVAGGLAQGLRAGCTATMPRSRARLTRPSPCQQPSTPSHRYPGYRYPGCRTSPRRLTYGSPCSLIQPPRHRSRTCKVHRRSAARKQLHQLFTDTLAVGIQAGGTRVDCTRRAHVLKSRQTRKFISQNCRGIKMDGRVG